MNNGGCIEQFIKGQKHKDFFHESAHAHAVVILTYHCDMEYSIALHKCLDNHLMTMLEATLKGNIKKSCFTVIHETHSCIY